eukprot:COSAG06_NODE_1990_length_7897_cov_2.527058_2_plen_1351_part_00
METLKRWEALETRIVDMVELRLKQAANGVYDCTVAIPCPVKEKKEKTKKQEPGAVPPIDGNDREEAEAEAEAEEEEEEEDTESTEEPTDEEEEKEQQENSSLPYEADEMRKLRAHASNEIWNMRQRLEDHRIAARSQLAGVKQIIVEGFPAKAGAKLEPGIVVNGTYKSLKSKRWPHYKNEHGVHLYHHNTKNLWIFNGNYKPDLGEYVAIASAQHGCLPTGRTEWKSQLENSAKERRISLTLSLPPLAKALPEESQDDIRGALDLVRNSTWISEPKGPTDSLQGSQQRNCLEVDGGAIEDELLAGVRPCKCYQFVAREGVEYVLETELGSIKDTMLYLISTDRQRVEKSNDDKSQENLASKIVWTCEADGIYYVAVRAYGDEGGTFKLTVTGDETNDQIDDRKDDLDEMYTQAIKEGVDQRKLEQVATARPVELEIKQCRAERDTIWSQLMPTLQELAATSADWADRVRNAGDGKPLDSWQGMASAKPGDVIGLLLDLPSDGPNNGSLKVYKNGHLLGTMVNGLQGKFCWCAIVCSGERVQWLTGPRCFPPKETPRREVEPWSKAARAREKVLREVMAKETVQFDAGAEVSASGVKSKRSEQEQWKERAQKADAAAQRAKFAQHFYHRPNMAVSAASCLQGEHLPNVTLAEMQTECVRKQSDKPIGFTFKGISGDVEGRGTGQLVTEEALIDSNNYKVPEQLYGEATRLPGATIDCKEFNLSNPEAMKAAIAHSRVIKAHGFNFFAQNDLPNRPVMCFFKRRLLTEVSTENLSTADAIVMDGLISTQRQRLVAAFARIAKRVGKSDSMMKVELVSGMSYEKDLLELVLSPKDVSDFQKADAAAQLKAFEFIESSKIDSEGFVSVMVKEQLRRTQTRERRKRKPVTSASSVDSWTPEERREVQDRLYSPRITPVDRYSVDGLDAADTILMETLPAAQRRRLTEAFRRIDGNSNGSVTKDELVNGLCHERDLLKLVVANTPKFLAGDHAAQMQAFKFIDGDGSRTLGSTEFVLRMVRQQMKIAENAENMMIINAEKEGGDWHNYTVRPKADGVYLWTDVPGSLPPLITKQQAPRMAKTYGPPTESQAQKLNPKYDAHNQLKYPYAFGSSAPTHWLTHEMAMGQHAKSGPEVTLVLPAKYRVVRTATVRLGPGTSSDQLGEHTPETLIDVVEEKTNSEGLAVVHTITEPSGWVELKAAKGKGRLLLERMVDADEQEEEMPLFNTQENKQTGQVARVMQGVPDSTLAPARNAEVKPGLILYSVQGEPSQGMDPKRYKKLVQQRPLKLGFVSTWEKLSAARPVTAQRPTAARSEFKQTSFKAQFEWAPDRKQQKVWAKPPLPQPGHLSECYHSV